MYKHSDIHYEPQHPMLKSIKLSQTEEFEEEEENLGLQEVQSGYFEASAACKKVKKPGMLGGSKAKKAYAKSVRCNKIGEGVDEALKRIPKATMDLMKNLNRSEKEKLKEAVKDAAGGFDSGKSTEDVLKALKGALSFKFKNGKKKDIASGKMVNNMIQIDIPSA